MIQFVKVQLGQHILFLTFYNKISKDIILMMEKMWSLVYIKGIYES